MSSPRTSEQSKAAPVLNDEQFRRVIREELHANLLVEAGAGSGCRVVLDTAATSGQRKLKTLPAPGALRTTISPSISRARLREMARPRPVPPWRRASGSSAREKRWKSRATVAWSMPMPLSMTSNSSCGSPSGPVRWRQHSTTLPASENLMALFSRL